jgi:hypothetical protein
MRASIAKNRAGIANIKIFMGGPSLRAFAEAGTKKNRTESPRSGRAPASANVQGCHIQGYSAREETAWLVPLRADL